MHIVVADPIHQGGIDRLLAAPGVTLDHPGNATNRTLEERLRDADGLIVRGTKVDDTLLANAERLRVVCRHGVGYDLVDVPALTRRGIALMITPEANAASVAEHRLIAGAIAAGDGDLAAHATHVHLHNALASILDSLSDTPEEPT